MAKIVEEKITIVVSQMLADDGATPVVSLVDVETRDSLKAVAQELIGTGALVEVIREEDA